MKKALLLACSWVLGLGCAASRASMDGLEPVAALLPPVLPEAAPLVESHFRGDQTTHISEDDLKRVLDAPVFVEEHARIGIVPVVGDYGPSDDVPLVSVPRVLADKVQSTGTFDVVTEVSTAWPKDRGLPGLRALAARYRCEYLLLYRHVFVEDVEMNAWGTAWLTVIGGLFVPYQTVRMAGAIEATLFEVKSGTILFTAYERMRGERDAHVWTSTRRKRELGEQLLSEASEALGEQVVTKIQETTRAAAAVREEGAGFLSDPSGGPRQRMERG